MNDDQLHMLQLIVKAYIMLDSKGLAVDESMMKGIGWSKKQLQNYRIELIRMAQRSPDNPMSSLILDQIAHLPLIEVGETMDIAKEHHDRLLEGIKSNLTD